MIRTRAALTAIMAVSVLTLGCGGSIGSGNGRPGTGGSGGTAGTGGSGGTGGTGGATGGTGGGTQPDGGDDAPESFDMNEMDGTGPDAEPPMPVPVTCEIANPQCNDGTDNDGDGLWDSADGECVAPCDNDEGSFATGIPGDNMDACKQDCFFDGNSGQGDDGCNWDLRCDMQAPGGAECPYEASRTCRAQSDRCVRNCRALTPNGCDCFGCCAVTYTGGSATVLLVNGCTADKFGDATACPRCTQNTECVNTCEPCEVCLGKSSPDPGCNTGTPGTDAGTGTGETDAGGGTEPDSGSSEPAPWCPAGVISCGPTGQVPANGCASGYYCQTGCCKQYVID
jgi:hypothetical protein